VIEAVSEGVVFSAFEHTADADAFAVLRPRLANAEKASAIFRAFKYSGRPYDFDFDFQTDAALVCTELVYKSYEPQAPVKGIKFPLVEVLGRLAMPANLIVKQFDEEFGKPGQQTELIAFYDGHERKGNAVESNLAEFRKSWQRPKWHIFVQETAR
ncbi:MAG: YiiX/YebB-like N1pC/P60 family cysteine hydrolase, partial [Betaproteobacteria bacterium]